MHSDIYKAYEKEEKKKNGSKYIVSPMNRDYSIAVNKYGALLNDKKRRRRSNGK